MSGAFEDSNRAYLTAALTWLRLRLQAMELARRETGSESAPTVEPATTPASETAEPWPTAAPSRRRWFARGDTVPAPPVAEPIRALPPAAPTAASTATAATEFQTALDAARIQLRAAETASPPPAMTTLANLFGLSPFERDTLLLCAAMELDPSIPELCARAYGAGNTPWPTFGCALNAFDEARWDSMSPERPLRRRRLVEVHQSGVQPLIGAPLRVDERIASYIAGLNYLDERLLTVLQAIDTDAERLDLTVSQESAVERAIGSVPSDSSDIAMHIVGADRTTRRAVAAAIAARLGLRLLALTADALPSSAEIDTLVDLWRRERHLLPLALLIDLPDVDISSEGATDAQTPAKRLLRVVARAGGVTMVCGRDVPSDTQPAAIVVEVEKATTDEQADAWLDALGDTHFAIADELAAQFSLDVASIRMIGRRERNRQDDPTPLRDRLWMACVQRSRPALEGLAQRIDARAPWDALKLPEREAATLARIRDRMQHRAVVHGRYGFRRHLTRGLGTAVLFCGEPGTGKTFAAEVLAASLHLPLYRIDLAGMMNKYIGVTEKHIRQVFDAGEGAVLLFDEADALFGKRSEVKDSHDRYANIQVDYLLQRMESYSGLAILSTNMRSAIDSAFLRRLGFVVNFPFPGPKEREAIWSKAFPEDAPLDDDVKFGTLSAMPLTGGSIQNVALDASFRAAALGPNSTVTMALIVEAARDEMRKLDQMPGSSMLRLARAPAGTVTQP